MKFLLFCFTLAVFIYTDCLIFEVLIYENVQHVVQMFSQISRAPNLIQKFWAADMLVFQSINFI